MVLFSGAKDGKRNSMAGTAKLFFDTRGSSKSAEQLFEVQ
jgi:hypothetical protein